MSRVAVSGVYWIQNNINGHIYVGSSINMDKRFIQHRSDLCGERHDNSYLQHAWNKYKEVAFEFRLLLICEIEELHIYEQCLLDLWKPEYNLNLLAAGGDYLKGKKFSDEHRRNISKAKMGHEVSKETRLKISKNHADVSGANNPMYGANFNGKNNPFYGKRHTDETKRKISDTQKRRYARLRANCG